MLRKIHILIASAIVLLTTLLAPGFQVLAAGNQSNIDSSMKLQLNQLLQKYTSTAKTATAVPAKTSTANTSTKTAAPTTAVKSASSKSSNPSSLVNSMLNMINEDRAKEGLKPLQLDNALSKGALTHSQEMADKNYFSHTSPTRGTFKEQLKLAGITYKTAGSNIALNGSVEKAHVALMNSEGHRANLMSPTFTKIGIGIVWSSTKNGYYITQWFTS